jgi:hypothetical protein
MAAVRGIFSRLAAILWIGSGPAAFQLERQGGFPMSRTEIGCHIGLVGIAALMLVGSAVGVVARATDPAAATSQDVAPCKTTTMSIKQLAIIDTTSDGDFQCLGLSLDGDSIKTIHLETHHFATAGRSTDNETIKIEEFPLEMLGGDHGAVLDGVPGHDAIILRGHFATPDRVRLVLSYLYNGVTGSYLACRLALERTTDAGWRLADGDDKTVSHIVVRTRDLPWVGGTFGIANLEGACDDPAP